MDATDNNRRVLLANSREASWNPASQRLRDGRTPTLDLGQQYPTP